MTLHRVVAVATRAREEMLDVTGEVAAAVAASGLESGVVTLFVPHTTAAVTLNESWDPDVQGDMLGWLARLVPVDAGFRHAEGNSDAHIKASLLGASAHVPFLAGNLLLGRWQGIYFCEFDGPRRRELHLLLQGEASRQAPT